MKSSPIAAMARHLWARIGSRQWTTLRRVFEQIPDPRDPRGVRHKLSDILTVAACAVLNGARTYLAMADWAAGHADLLAARGIAPASKDTFRRVLSRLDGDVFDRDLGRWARQLAKTCQAVAVDGKEERGTRHHGEPVRLLCAATHVTGAVIGQVQVGAKTNEIPMVRALLDQIGQVKGITFTLDALHTQRATAKLITARGAHWVLTVKRNQPTLLDQVTALPWNEIPPAATTRERSHGRDTTRTIAVCQTTGPLDFPHVAQVAKITRTTTQNGHTTSETAYIITDLDPAHTPPGDLAQLVQDHWTVENSVHWCRDTAWQEDHHQAATGPGPRVMATLRNTAMTVIRCLGGREIARTLRFLATDPQLTAAITGL
jgi:predicted transposase YbfD/YdcC